MKICTIKKRKMLNVVEDIDVNVDIDANRVRKMAAYFNAELDEDNDALTITMDNQKAKGFISSYQISSGLSVRVYNITFHSDLVVDLERSRDGPYCFCYNVQGHFLHRFGNQEEFVKIHQNQNIIVKGSSETSAQTVFPADVKLKIALIIVDLKLLGSLGLRNAKRIYKKVGEIFQNHPSNLNYRHIGGIEAQTEKFASIVCENNNVGLVAGLLAEGAVFNMLASQINAYSSDIINKKPTLSKSELSKITSLRSYVINNLEISFTILKLSRYFGISPKKLQMGVKYLYGDSVGHYILSLRMSHAKHLLITADFNVSEVCDRVGISSRSYFSKVFKARYGKLPSEYIH